MNNLSNSINDIQIVIINEFLNFLVSLSKSDWQIIVSAIPPIFAFLFYCLNIKEDDTPIARRLKQFVDLLFILLLTSVLCVIALINEHKPSLIESFIIPLFRNILIDTYILAIASTSSCVGLYVFHFRVVQPLINKVKIWFKKKAQKELNTPNFKAVAKELKTKIAIDHLKQFKKARNKKSVFLGLNNNHKPIYCTLDKFNKSNIQLVGAPGTGKGVMAASLLWQSIVNDDACFVFAPKRDEFCESVLNKACVQANKNLVVVDLSLPIPQINPLFKANSSEAYEILVNTCNLMRTGAPSDFHQNNNRNGAVIISEHCSINNQCVSSLFERAISTNDDSLKNSDGLLNQLKELSNLDSIKTLTGIDLKETLNQGGCILIIGSTRNDIIKTAMKMLLIRLVQLIENRDDKSRHATIFIDELKYMNSLFFINSIGTLRDKNANYIIAHQSLVDLKQSDSHLNEDTCAQTIVDTCTIRWIYQCQDFETATWVSTLCGSQSTYQPSTYSKSNPLFAEIQNLDKQSTLIEEPVIHSNYVQYMPDNWAVCVGSSSTYASLAYIAYIPVEIVEVERIAYPRYEMEDLL